jgi:hypothetical protein
MCAYGAGNLGSVPKYSIFNHQVYNGCGDCKMPMFKPFHSFIIFFPLLTFYNNKSSSTFASSGLSLSNIEILGILKLTVQLPLH